MNMLSKLEKIKNDFIEILVKENGSINKEQIDFLGRYTQYMNEKLEECNIDFI